MYMFALLFIHKCLWNLGLKPLIFKKKIKAIKQSLPILLFSLSPGPPSLSPKPRHSVPLNKNSQNNALKTCKAISRHCQRIVPLRSDEHFAEKSDVHVNWPPLRDSPDSLWSICSSSELTQNVSLRTSQR